MLVSAHTFTIFSWVICQDPIQRKYVDSKQYHFHQNPNINRMNKTFYIQLLDIIFFLSITDMNMQFQNNLWFYNLI